MVWLQALFGKLQQLATVAGDVLVGREKIQKTLLARLTLTVVMWLSDEQEFWGVLEDQSAPLQAPGLQQVIFYPDCLPIHFFNCKVEYMLRNVNQQQIGRCAEHSCVPEYRVQTVHIPYSCMCTAVPFLLLCLIVRFLTSIANC